MPNLGEIPKHTVVALHMVRFSSGSLLPDATIFIFPFAPESNYVGTWHARSQAPAWEGTVLEALPPEDPDQTAILASKSICCFLGRGFAWELAHTLESWGEDYLTNHNVFLRKQKHEPHTPLFVAPPVAEQYGLRWSQHQDHCFKLQHDSQR